MTFRFPKIYPILDVSFIPANGRVEFLRRLGGELTQSGVTLLEYRNKSGSDNQMKADAEILRAAMPVAKVKLILDDRAELVEQFGFDGVHVDAGDVPPAEARRLVGPHRIVGTFAGGDSLLPGVLDAPVDYLAVGPVFTTVTKQTSKAPIGPEGVRRMRQEIGPNRIITAAAGIKFENAATILAAGASTVAVAGAIFRAPDPAAEIRRWMAHLG